MKHHLIALALWVSPLLALGQEAPQKEHFIEVTGHAEQEIEPNEIYVMIRLKEFEENRQKTSLERLDTDFQNALKKAGIDRKRLELADAGSRLDTFRRRDQESFRSKTYQIKLTSAAELEKFLESLASVQVDLVDITRLHHSDYEKIYTDLKIKALQNAKARAEALLTSIGAEIGKPTMVRDWDIQPFEPRMEMSEMRMMKGELDAGGQQDPIGFRKIKLRAQITAQFEIE